MTLTSIFNEGVHLCADLSNLRKMTRVYLLKLKERGVLSLTRGHGALCLFNCLSKVATAFMEMLGSIKNLGLSQWQSESPLW